jgi:hypothetical protein
MERFPSKCTIDFEIEEFPCSPITYKALSETEGRLIISVDDRAIFNEENILLAELYVAFKFWFSNGACEDFKYDSMDFEESPIIEVIVTDTLIYFSSVWMDKKWLFPVGIEKQGFIDSVQSFICRFESELPEIKVLS